MKLNICGDEVISVVAESSVRDGDVEKKVVALRRLFMWRELKGTSVRLWIWGSGSANLEGSSWKRVARLATAFVAITCC